MILVCGVASALPVQAERNKNVRIAVALCNLRSFSKLSLVKTKLRSVMSQDRLEALLLASTQIDILLQLNDADLVACLAAKADRCMLLA